MTNTIGYLRVSDPRQATEDKVTLDAQRQAIITLAEQHQRTVGEWFSDPGVSGGTADRPGFQAMVTYCQTHECPDGDGLVLVYRHDRFGRFADLDEYGYWRRILRLAGWVVRYAIDDPEDQTTRDVTRFVGSLTATRERQVISDRARMGMRGAAERGFWVNKNPFGYRREARDMTSGHTRVLESGQRNAPNERIHLVPGPAAEVAFVLWLFRRYAEGTVTLEQLKREAPKHYPKQWSRRSLHFMLVNPAYIGDQVFGLHPHGRPKAKPQTVRDTHPALVPREMFARVQAILKRNRRESTRRPGYFPFTGLITCEHCGGPYIGGGGRKGPAEDPDRFKQYVDAMGRRGQCEGKLSTFLRRDVEPQIIDAVAQVLEQQPIEAVLREAFDALLRVAHDGTGTLRQDLEREQMRQQQKLDRLIHQVEEGTFSDRDIAQRATLIRGRLTEIEQSLHRIRFDARRVEAISDERERLVGLAMSFREVAPQLTGVELREFVRPWLAGAVVDKVKKTLTLTIRLLPSVEGSALLFSSGGR